MTMTRREMLALSAAAAAAPAARAQTSPRGGALEMVIGQRPRRLNGALQPGVATALPSTQIFASLVRFDRGWAPEPYLAESWSIAEDGLSVSFRLRDDAVFHDGRPVTSEDVAFSIETIAKRTPFTDMLAPVRRVDASQPKTAVFRLSRPHPALFMALSPALGPILPRHVYGDGRRAAREAVDLAPVGAGPFRVGEVAPGERIELLRAETYFRPDRPFLDRIVMRVERVPARRVKAMREGAHFTPFLADADAVRSLRRLYELEVSDAGYAAFGQLNWLAFNTSSPKLADQRVRRAITLALDPAHIASVIHSGVSRVQRGPIPEGSPFFDDTLPAHTPDPELARALLDAAGAGDGLTLMLDFIPGAPEQQRDVAWYIRDQLGLIGVKVTLRDSPDMGAWARRVAAQDFEMTLDTAPTWGDPAIALARRFRSDGARGGEIWANTQAYANTEADRLLANAGAAWDPARRAAGYAAFQQVIAQDAPVFHLNATPYHSVWDRKLGAPPVGVWGPLHPLDELHWRET